MITFIRDNIDALKRFCDAEGLSVDKILKSPKCYTKDFMLIQHIDRNKAREGLRCEEPAEVLLIIRKTKDNQISFSACKNAKKYLSD